MNTMLEYKGYHAVVEYDADDNIFVGEVFGVTDSLNFHGRSVDEINEMFSQCIDNYLELCERIEKNPDKEFKGSFNVRISPELHKKAALEATKRKITLNQFVQKAIAEALEEKDKFREIMVYVPYSTKGMDWENGIDYDFASFYQEGTVLMKKESMAYAGN